MLASQSGPDRRLTIALDATYAVGRNLTGVGVYSREILTGLPRLQTTTRFLYCLRPHRLTRSFGLPSARNVSRRLLLDRWGPTSADLFHGLNQRLPSVRFRRTVCTFHDLFVLTADYSTPEFRYRFAEQARHAAERADRIIAVSRFTADQIADLLKVPHHRIAVVPHGVHAPDPQALPSWDVREPIILHIGALQARKNLNRLVEAFETLPPPWRLVLAGSSGYGAAEILARIDASSARERIELPGYVTDSQLRSLYHRARIFAFPSLDEGFGIPLLEAMAHGIPVVTSKRGATLEVSEGAAILVDPLSVEDIRAGLIRLASAEDTRNTLIRNGLQKAREYAWETAVQRTWEVYQQLL